MGKSSKNKLPDLRKQDIFKPLDLNQIGSNGDPCFGKQYDLSTHECKMCGDSELCAIVFAQGMNKTRGELEKEQHFKDMDVLIDIPSVKKAMRKMKRNGMEKKQILDEAQKKFEISRADARSIYRTITTK